MDQSIEPLLIEAGDPATSPERLRQLCEWKQFDERARLRETIAGNPNTDDNLLCELASKYPVEVIGNPQFQLLLLSGDHWWENCEPIGTLKLLAELGASAPKEARDYLIGMLAGRLMESEPLPMNMECHYSFSEDVTVQWRPNSLEDSGHKGSNEEQLDELEQEFCIHFSCVVEDNLYFLRPPNEVKDSLGLLVQLLRAKPDELLGTLLVCGWVAEFDSAPGGQGFWGIESVEPGLDDWDLEADLDGNGSGIVQITDPVGITHDIKIEFYDYEKIEDLNPALNHHIDPIASIFESNDGPQDLRAFLRKVIE